MKKWLLASITLICGMQSRAQTAADYAIQVQATVQVAPPQVSLIWRKIPGATGYTIQKKAKGTTAWASLASIADTFYNDLAVKSDSLYEYRIYNSGGSTAAFGYMCAGINSPAQHNRGGLVLICDTLMRDSCSAEITKLMQDLNADGWSIVRHNVKRTVPDSMIKKMIQSDFATRPDLKAVLLLGHVAVPYSGELNPDAHPDHLGAWPADLFYADTSLIYWKDASVNNSAASRAENKNVPGDGKWDFNSCPVTPVLQVSRIDFYKMTAFGKTEAGLMKSYLAKAHQYKMDSIYVSRKALIDDNFGAFSGEAFAANGWRNFPGMIGRNNMVTADLISTLNDSAYQWSYGCGGGSYTSCSGVGVSTDFAGKNYKGIFTMLFGSYFGDWDNQNNFLRAPLCAPDPALASCWAGRPNWFLHHMALGENIGYSTLLTQTQGGSIYPPAGYMAQAIHIALMGDGSLRTDYIKPAGSLSLSPVKDKGITISWSPSPDPGVIGYYVYRTDSLYGTYTKLSNLVSGTSFKDTVGKNGLHYYQVRPCKLQSTPSGTYYNLGLGISDTATVNFPKPVSIRETASIQAEMRCFPNPAGELLTVHVNTNGSRGTGILRLIDLNGRILKSVALQADKEELTHTFQLAELPAGNYMVTLQLAEAPVLVEKLIKL
jgi:hypothetical protein